MKTYDEIVVKVREIANGFDIFGTVKDLIFYLPFDKAKQFLNEDVTLEEFTKLSGIYTRENVIKEIKEYLPFAFDKAENERGLSANRSIDHFKCWLFLIDDQELLDFAEKDGNYAMYGKPILERIKERYG
ncbi:MAG: hypothetical protein V3U54_12785 [Thermodesulfobacteriota bacterium]